MVHAVAAAIPTRNKGFATATLDSSSPRFFQSPTDNIPIKTTHVTSNSHHTDRSVPMRHTRYVAIGTIPIETGTLSVSRRSPEPLRKSQTSDNHPATYPG